MCISNVDTLASLTDSPCVLLLAIPGTWRREIAAEEKDTGEALQVDN